MLNLMKRAFSKTTTHKCQAQRWPRLVGGLLSASLMAGLMVSPPAMILATDADADAELPDDDEPIAEPGEIISGEGFELVAEDQGRKLFVNLSTSEIAVEDSLSGESWYSNPQDRDTDQIANGANKSRLGSQMMIGYFTPTSQQILKDNYLDSITNEQFEVEVLEDGVKISYIIGEKPAEYIHPLAITTERFQEIFDLSDAGAQRILNRRYTLYDLAELSEAAAAEALALYPGLAESSLYILRDGISEFILEEIHQAFLAAGYTEEEKIADEQLAGIEAGEAQVQNVSLAIYYSLDQGDLIVEVPIDEIDFDPSYPLTQLRLLEYFGTGGLEDEGYLFVPDGSGALIRFNNNKLSATQYLSSVYGDDIAVRKGLQVGMTEQIALPVFGIKKNDQAFVAIIEEGAALASIRADVSGRVNSYNTVSPVFQILAQDEVDLKELAGNNVIMAYQQQAYEGDIRIRYHFLTGENADYSGMAAGYRDYLRNNGTLQALTEEGLPLQLEVLGAVDRIKPVLGIPVNSIQALTTFTETKEIVEDLRSAGVTNLDLRLSGWFNGGLRQSVANKVKLQKQLGSGRDFKALTDYLQGAGVGFYPDATFTYTHRNSFFDNVILTRDASRYLDREVVELGKYRASTMSVPPAADPFWALAPQKIQSYAADFLGRYDDLGTRGLSLRDLGQDLGANYNRKDELDRESALHIWQSIMANMKDADLALMAEYGNAYVLPYADVLIDLPTGSSKYQIMDESVPFLQMVLHGSIDYSLEAVNMSANPADAFLAMLETGASPRFVVMREKNSILKDSDYNHYFSVEYDSWRERILETYEELEPILAPLRTATIERHEFLAQGVAKVSYSDGSVLYVNRSGQNFQSDDGNVSAMDYLLR